MILNKKVDELTADDRIAVNNCLSEGIVAIFISSVIMGILLAQAVNLNTTQGFYVYHSMEVFTWIIGVILLRRKQKEYAVTIGLSFEIAFVYQLFRVCEEKSVIKLFYDNDWGWRRDCQVFCVSFKKNF